jgi:methylated-DNA-protein-cysteine methyltransferase related protein
MGKKVIIKQAAKQTKKEQIPSTVKEYSFFQDVFDVVRQIPKGRVTSYGAIANYLGTRLSARMVGWAMNAAGLAKPKIPAHRVVNSQGMLSGKVHFGSPTAMEDMLKKEKVLVKDDKIVDFKKVFWDPVTELGLQ